MRALSEAPSLCGRRRYAYSDRLQLPGWLQRGRVITSPPLYLSRSLGLVQHQIVVLWGGTQYKDGEVQRQGEG